MGNKKKLFIIIMSAIFAAVLCCTFLFSIRPTYASEVKIVSTDGTSVYLTGEGVTWDKEKQKYTIANSSNVKVHVVNEYRNDMMAEGKDTTDVDEVLLKVAKAKRGRFKEKECDEHDYR